MTIRSTIERSRKAPKVAQLVLNRETVQELTAIEAETVAGGQVFKPRLTEWCPGGTDLCTTRGLDCITIWRSCGLKCTNSQLCR